MDLTARAVAFITLAQDISYAIQPQKNKGGLEPVVLLQGPETLLVQLRAAKDKDHETFQERISEIVQITVNSPSDFEGAYNTWLNRSNDLLQWLKEKKDILYPKLRYYHLPSDPGTSSSVKHLRPASLYYLPDPEQEKGRIDPYPAPQQWRVAIRHVMYTDHDSRIDLARALNYLPVLVELAHKGDNISEAERATFEKNWQSDTAALAILEDDDLLFKGLMVNQIPLPFDIIYRQELGEIKKSRQGRNQLNRPDDHDPRQQAKSLELRALAFSGGGIRSATFNLGILQGLAKAGLLPRFDYLSTVSGGGYIGTWFAAWIKRDGLLLKVQDRLNPEKSADPRGEEVRPIRWLRMFSNYLAPNNNIMSTDSWTMGMTWIRNTLLNQVIILLLLCSVLLAGFWGFLLWSDDRWHQAINQGTAFAIFSALLFLGALLAGLGMGAYQPDLSPNKFFGSPKTTFVTAWLLSLGLIIAFLVSSWLFAPATTETDSFNERYYSLLAIAGVSTLALLVIAVLGRYDILLPGDNLKTKSVPIVLGIIFSVLSAFFGILLLDLAWGVMQDLADTSTCLTSWNASFTDANNMFNWSAFFKTREFLSRLAFIIGPPLILEVLSLTVVVRMALLGKYFPDERREWWGRIGALVHRGILGWIVLSSIGLLGGKLVDAFSTYLPTVAGGWFALIGAAVRLAYGTGTTVVGSAPKTMTMKAQDILVRVAPYLFIVGFLIIAAKINYLVLHYYSWFTDPDPKPHYVVWRVFAFTLALTIFTFGLAWRVGVNEFSMHHFYRNRLMRGYLATTRRRTERAKTANEFTGFDDEDDMKLCSLRNKEGYHGPFPIINATLNASQVTDLDRQDRKGESFVFTPLFCGFDISPTRPNGSQKTKSSEYGYRPTEQYAYPAKTLPGREPIPGGPDLSTAMAISGAAANPNQGAHSSPATAFLMTVFNARLGWWIGNPREQAWERSDPRAGLAYLIYDLLGRTSIAQDFVCLSDGGHFDNMGLYELIRRRVRLIVLGDAEQDTPLTCEGLANAVRRCRVDFGVEIVIDVTDITRRDDKTAQSACHYALGTIWYPEDPEGQPSGRLIYLKSSLTGDEPVDVREYAASNPDFPQQSTADQFFSESQFESYRRLGLHVMETALANPKIYSLLS